MQYGTVLTWSFLYSGLCGTILARFLKDTEVRQKKTKKEENVTRRADALLRGPGEIPASNLAHVARA